MKTTFKEVFNGIDDDLLTDISEENLSDFDMDIDENKIKADVFMRISNDNGKVKKFSKKVTVLLIAAVILTLGTVGVFAARNLDDIFGGLFNHGSNLNEIGLYDGGDVSVSSTDDSLNIKLLGVTGDGEKLFSVIEITRKDGSEVIEKDYNKFSSATAHDALIMIYTKDGEHAPAYSNAVFDLSNDNKVLKVSTYSFGLEEDVMDGTMTITMNYLNAYKIDKELASLDLPLNLDGAINRDMYFDEEFEAEKRKEFGLTDEDKCFYFDYNNKRSYCHGDQKRFDIPFEITFELNYRTDNFTEVELSAETAPNVIEPFAEDAKMTITPFGVYLTANCDEGNTDKDADGSKCFKLRDANEESKIILNDGTVYYLYNIFVFEEESNNTGKTSERCPMNIYMAPGVHYYMNFTAIDPREVAMISINGDLVYTN